MGDVYGRKPIYIVGFIMHIGFMISILHTHNQIVAYISIFIFGMSVTARYYVGYTYNLEM